MQFQILGYNHIKNTISNWILVYTIDLNVYNYYILIQKIKINKKDICCWGIKKFYIMKNTVNYFIKTLL